MARKTQAQTQVAAQPQPVVTFPHLAASDVGNGGCKVISSQLPEVVSFEPVITSLTDKRALTGDDSKPTYTLQSDGQTLVFGLDDCMTFGRRETMRRLNSMERYTSPDYFRLLDVLLLQAFACDLDHSTYIAPTLILSLPVSQFNNLATVAEVRETLMGTRGKRIIHDGEGRELRLEIQNERLIILPESAGALMHWAQDPLTLARRENINTAGYTLVIDVGYETTDFSLFEGMKYLRDRATSVSRMGMGVLVRRIQEVLAGKRVRSVDETALDRALRPIAGRVKGAKKEIEPSPGTLVDVTKLYDLEIEELANQISDRALSLYPEAINRVLIAGGGAYHLHGKLLSLLAPMDVLIVPNAENANLIGAYTSLQLKFRRA